MYFVSKKMRAWRRKPNLGFFFCFMLNQRLPGDQLYDPCFSVLSKSMTLEVATLIHRFISQSAYYKENFNFENCKPMLVLEFLVF